MDGTGDGAMGGCRGGARGGGDGRGTETVAIVAVLSDSTVTPSSEASSIGVRAFMMFTVWSCAAAVSGAMIRAITWTLAGAMSSTMSDVGTSKRLARARRNASASKLSTVPESCKDMDTKRRNTLPGKVGG